MPTQVTKLRVFVASPGGLDSFRENFNKTMAEYNRLEALPLDVLFEPVGWEVTIGGHTRAQEAINKELRTCDYAVFMVRDRWGSQPDAAGKYASGFEEEWAIAQEMLDAKQMLNIAVCFFPVPESQSKDPGDQFKKVIAFRKMLVDGKKEFFKPLKDDHEFEPWLRGYLAAWRRQNEKLDTTSADDTKISHAEAAPPSPPLESGHASATETALVMQLNELADKEEWAALRAFSTAVETLLVEPVNQAFALHLRGYALGQLNQSAEAIAVYDDLLARFSATTELSLREQVAKAIFSKGFRLGQLNQSAEAIAAYDDLLARFGAATELSLREQVAKALFNKGITLGQLNRSAETIAVYDDLLARFGAATELALREPVAQALFNKGVRLAQLNQSAEEIAVYDDLLARFGAATEPELLKVVTLARTQLAKISGTKSV